MTVESILKAAQKKYPQIGIATVYRTVKLLLSQDRIQAVVLPKGETRYELAGTEHHHHFQCSSCGAVFCMDFCPFTGRGGLRLPRGFRARSHSITIHGLCPGCGK